MKVLILLLLCLIFQTSYGQDTIKTKGVFISVRKQNPLNLLRFYPTSFIFNKKGTWYDDRGREIRRKLVFRIEENDMLVAVRN